jgi:hypothetical protein
MNKIEIGTNQFNGACCKCRRGPIERPRYSARAKECQRWVAACRTCFPDAATGKKAVIEHIKKHGCAYQDCVVCISKVMLGGSGGLGSIFGPGGLA